MKRIFITGIAGFIGFHLALVLKKRGDCVMGCDNFNPYYDPALKKRRAELLQSAGVDVICSDIHDSEQLNAALQKLAPTHFVHLAAQAGVRHGITHPEAYVHSNLSGFVSILELLRRYPSVPLIYASSSSVYGLNPKIPFSEDDPTHSPASFYGATKKCNEVMAHAYHHLYGIPCTGLRFFTVYGPWGRPDMAYFSFAQAIAEGKSISVYGDGQLRRDFTYIDDIVQGTAAAIDLSLPHAIFNLGNSEPHSILDMVRILEKALGKEARIAYCAGPQGEVPMTYADISRAKKMLGYAPRTSLQEGLTQFIQWFQTSDFLHERNDKSLLLQTEK
jgi:UDP-glucuronate 4-epimerase